MSVRELSVTYGGITVGGTSTTYLLDGFTRHEVTDGKATSYVEFDCVAVADTSAGLKAACDGIERVFRTPRKTLSVSQSGCSLLHADHDSATGGVNTEPSIVKAGQIGDSGRSRRYRLRVAYETPADTAGTSGLRESAVNVEYDPARIRTVRISGTFTAVPGTTSARARYDAAIAAHVASIKSALSVTVWELQEEPTTEQDYDDKTLRFERVYRELIFGQGQDDANDDAAIVKQTLTVSRRDISEERTPGQDAPEGEETNDDVVSNVQALSTFDLRYEADIDQNETTDLRSKYETIRAWLISQFSSFFAQGQFALMVERPDYDRVNNRITVEMSAEGPITGVSIVRRTITTEDNKTEPHVFRGAWTGDPLSHYVYQGFTVHLRTTTTTIRALSKESRELGEDQDEADPVVGGGVGGASGFRTVSRVTTRTPIRIGIEGSGQTLDMLDTTTVLTQRRVNEVGGGGGGGGSFGGAAGIPGSSGRIGSGFSGGGIAGG